MSTIAAVYRIDIPSLTSAVGLWDQKKYAEFWEVMASCEPFSFPYSGYVLGAAIAFANSRGVKLPQKTDLQILSSEHRKAIGLLAMGNAADFAPAASGLADLRATDPEFRRFYNDLYDHDWDEAATAMREGFSFLERAIRTIEFTDDLLLVTAH